MSSGDRNKPRSNQKHKNEQHMNALNSYKTNMESFTGQEDKCHTIVDHQNAIIAKRSTLIANKLGELQDTIGRLEINNFYRECVTLWKRIISSIYSNPCGDDDPDGGRGTYGWDPLYKLGRISQLMISTGDARVLEIKHVSPLSL
jgi:hypothetical protein